MCVSTIQINYTYCKTCSALAPVLAGSSGTAAAATIPATPHAIPAATAAVAPVAAERVLLLGDSPETRQ